MERCLRFRADVCWLLIFVFIAAYDVTVQQNVTGHCVMKGDCGIDPLSSLQVPCVYNGAPSALENETAISIMNDLCPDLTNASDLVCCDEMQVVLLKKNLDKLGSLFKRCPSCYHNLANVFCQMTCSPNQSLFLEVTVHGDKPNGTEAVKNLTYYLTENFADGLFDSCNNVHLGFSSMKAVDLTCGTVPGNCTPSQWLETMGKHGLSPFQIDFFFEDQDVVIVNETAYYPMNNTIVPCYQPVKPGGPICSCTDCPCNPQPPAEFPDMNYKLFGVPLMQIVMIIVFLILCIVIASGFAYSYIKNSKRDESLLPPEEVKVESINCCASWGVVMDNKLKNFFTRLAFVCASYPIPVLLLGAIFIAVCSCGLLFFTITTNPVQLWSAPNSQARIEKEYFDKHFGPFYRTEQVIITRVNQTPVVADNVTFSSVFDREFLHQVLALQTDITSLTADIDNKIVHFEDICFAPVNKGKCMIQSVVNWFQDNPKHLDYYKDTSEYMNFLKQCFANPFFIQSEGLSCLGDYGGPIFPYVALGGVTDENYSNASALILTFMVRNHLLADDNSAAIAWEGRFIDFMKNFSHPDMHLSFSSERSIEDELSRESHSDVKTILISYLVMFAYISITLGKFHSLRHLFLHSKLMLGLSGICIVLASVISSLGVFSYMGISATLIIIEVIPFLVLAVGVDNIFIIVQSYQRSTRMEGESREQHISRIFGQISPSLLLAGFAESSCFFLGALSTMPAVHIFALYSGLALLIDLILQMTCFVAVLSLDAAREESRRFDICCCVKSDDVEVFQRGDGLLHNLFKKCYAPFLMKKWVRATVLLLFTGWLCLSIGVISEIDVGLDQKLSMPEDSYVLKYFDSLEKYLSVGPPVYFVVKSGYDYSHINNQNNLCSSALCNRDSLVTQLSDASIFSNITYIAHPPLDWLDSYFSWANDQSSCCRIFVNNGSFCPSTVHTTGCEGCNASDNAHFRPYPERFDVFLKYFLNDNPNADCPVAGHAGFADAVEILADNGTGATHFMTYHTILKTSEDYTEALRWSRQIAKNITSAFHNDNESVSEGEVFPYSIFYVFYEQYLTVSKEAVVNVIISIADIFIVAFLLMGLDIHSAIVMIVTILMILFDLMGVMYFWSISLNAVSLVNLVMTIGISVEFCSHIIRSFAFNSQGDKIERAQNAVAYMGSSVLSGITLTKFAGIIVLAFSKSQIFQVFYFRMYFSMVLIGAAHGLIFLPVFLSIIGPPIKKKLKDEEDDGSVNFSVKEEKE